MTAAARRLQSLTSLLAHVRERLGSTSASCCGTAPRSRPISPPTRWRFAIADEGAVAALIRRPEARHAVQSAGLGAPRAAQRHGVRPDDAAAARAHEEFRKVAGQDAGASHRGAVPVRAARRALAARRGARRRDRPATAARQANKENIQYHYDVSNAFYALFLDPEMVYTCALFHRAARRHRAGAARQARHDLPQAAAEAGRNAFSTSAAAGARWSCHAAQNYGVRAHGVTLSQEQFDLRQEKVERLGLQDRVTIELRDYRTLEGTFDKIASIGMFEHVGIANHPSLFPTDEPAAQAGRALSAPRHHARRPSATTASSSARNAPKHARSRATSFPAASSTTSACRSANLERYGFEVHDVEGWREHYARTGGCGTTGCWPITPRPSARSAR